MKKHMHLKTNNELFLFINVEVIELFELFIENPDEPSLQVNQLRVAMIVVGICRELVIGMKKKSEVRRERINSCSGCREALEELLEGLVAEELVPPLRKGLLQVDPELFPEFHCFPLSKITTQQDEK